MVLADTSVWIDHLRGRNTSLTEYLDADLVFMHPFVAGELACGNLKNRISILADLAVLPRAHIASSEECHSLLENRKLWGRGIGWVDLHLLVSALLSNCELWTLDRHLQTVARRAGVRLKP